MKEAQDALRLSDWKTPVTPPPVAPPVPPPPAVVPAAAAVPPLETLEPLTEKSSAPKENPLPPPGTAPSTPPFKASPTVFQGFDLLRLPGGILRRWWMLALLVPVGLGLGLWAGLKLFSISATVSVRLMARAPQSFAVSNNSYVPSRLQGATLMGALASPQVAREVADKLGGKYSAKELQGMVEIQEVRKTDFVDIVVTTPFSAEETAEFATLWAREAMAFTSRLQAEESGEMKTYLTEQLHKTDRELEKVNQQIVAMRDKAGVVDVEKEIEAYLKSVGDLDLRYETNRVDLEALDFQLESLRREIRKHSPSFEELKTEEAKLAEMAEYYTPQNPIYLEASDRVEALRQRVQREIQSNEVPLSDFTGTYVGNALYLQILELESRRESLTLQQQQLETMRAQAREKLKELPEMAMEAGPLLESAQALRSARDALLGRLQEVAAFQELAPGYYRMFKAPTAKDVVVSSRKVKLIVLAVLGGVFFGGLGLLGAAGMEFLDPLVKTSAEAEAALQARCLAHLPPEKSRSLFSKGSTGPRPQDLWASVIGPLATGRIRTFWSPLPSEAINRFWDLLLEAGQGMEVRILLVHLAGELPARFASIPRIAAHQLQNPPPTERVLLVELAPGASAAETKEFGEKIQAADRAFAEIWVEVSGPVREPAAGLVRTFPETILLCALGKADRQFWQTQRTLLTTHRPLRGAVTLG